MGPSGPRLGNTALVEFFSMSQHDVHSTSSSNLQWKSAIRTPLMNFTSVLSSYSMRTCAKSNGNGIRWRMKMKMTYTLVSQSFQALSKGFFKSCKTETETSNEQVHQKCQSIYALHFKRMFLNHEHLKHSLSLMLVKGIHQKEAAIILLKQHIQMSKQSIILI